MDKDRLTNKAMNVIIFIGDGLGVSTVTASRIFNAQEYNLDRKEAYMAWDRLDHVGLSMVG